MSTTQGPVLHLRGRVLLGPDEERPEAWVVGGRITYVAPLARVDEAVDVAGVVLPGLVDAHCHVGLDAGGPVDRETQVEQATVERDDAPRELSPEELAAPREPEPRAQQDPAPAPAPAPAPQPSSPPPLVPAPAG